MKKIMVIVAALAMMTGSAYAAEWNFFGSARVATFITDVDNPGVTPDTNNFVENLQGNSRIGANVKVSDELTGRFELGIGEAQPGGLSGVETRLLYGEWNFGAGKLLVGQAYTPLNMFYSNQVYAADNNLLNYGGVYGGRNPALQLTFGDFQIAALPTANAAVSGFAVTETNMPKIEASYRLAMDNFHVALQGGYNSYEVGNTEDIDSYVLALGAGVKFGAGYLQGNIWTGENVGPYGLYNAPADDPAIVAGKVVDNEAFGWLLVAGYKFNDMIGLEVGYAQAEAEMDATGSIEDDVAAYYVQTTVGLAPGVFIVPEIGVIDNKKNAAGVDESEITYYGIKWQINF